jgi:L-methionine (R)-S-oxide reductase
MWTELAREARSLTESEPDEVANMANTAALLHAALNAAFDNTVIWTGFYRVASAETLMLGPFQGRVACIRIPFGSGVCGAAAARREAVVVPDVDKFPGHIACDCEWHTREWTHDF